MLAAPHVGYSIRRDNRRDAVTHARAPQRQLPYLVLSGAFDPSQSTHTHDRPGRYWTQREAGSRSSPCIYMASLPHRARESSSISLRPSFCHRSTRSRQLRSKTCSGPVDSRNAFLGYSRSISAEDSSRALDWARTVHCRHFSSCINPSTSPQHAPDTGASFAFLDDRMDWSRGNG